MARYDGGPQLRQRVVSIYRVFTGAKNDRGAVSWFAHECDVGRVTASRWFNGHREVPPTVLKLLEALESFTTKMIAERKDSGRFKTTGRTS